MDAACQTDVGGTRSPHATGEPFPRDWLERLGTQLADFAPLRALAPPPSDAPCVVFFSVVPWWHSVFEHLLATSLRLKHVHTPTIVCGGGFPACSNGNAICPRPACDACLARARRYARTFELECWTSHDFLTAEDRARTERLVAELPRARLATFTYAGLPVGRNTLRDLSQHYHYAVRDITAAEEAAARQFLVSSMLSADLARRVHERFAPRGVVVSNGKAVSYSSIYSYFRRAPVDVFTWDESPMFRNAFTFNRNVFAPEVHLEDVWPRYAEVPLTSRQERVLDEYLRDWREGRTPTFVYNDEQAADAGVLAKIEHAAAGRRIVAVFSNVTWDTAHLDRNIGFDHLVTAVQHLVGQAAAQSDLYLVIRPHPAEYKLPVEERTVVRLEEHLRPLGPLPANVRLISGDVELNSYRLARLADLLLVYTSTIGLELALDGREVAVLGDVHYRGKGFTVDIESPAQLHEYLARTRARPATSPQRRERARRYMWLWLYRHLVRLPWVDPVSRKRYRIDDLDALRPGSGSVVDELTARMLDGRPFLDMVAPGHAPD